MHIRDAVYSALYVLCLAAILIFIILCLTAYESFLFKGGLA